MQFDKWATFILSSEMKLILLSLKLLARVCVWWKRKTNSNGKANEKYPMNDKS